MYSTTKIQAYHFCDQIFEKVMYDASHSPELKRNNDMKQEKDLNEKEEKATQEPVAETQNTTGEAEQGGISGKKRRCRPDPAAVL